MNNDIKNRFIEYGKYNDKVVSIFYLKSNTDEDFVDLCTVVDEVIVGKLEEELKSLFTDVFLINRVKSSFALDKDRQNYTILEAFTERGVKISESIIAYDFLEDFIRQIPKDIEFIYNRSDLGQINPNKNFKYDLPKEYEFKATVDSFFARAYEVSLYLGQNDVIASSLVMDKLRSELSKMLNFYVINKFFGLRDMGLDGKNFDQTLSKEIKEDFELTFATNDPLDIYNCLFKACGLFRKVGMAEAEKLGYEYNKEADVKTLKLLRKNYKKLEALLR
ncbi:aminoglycoside 6-adenylyltransferase [Anaerococcus sp. AGMB09787]|uniref:aminoglycoside 6-adenylyltransferase n=1 Tax=Anaerococcus sp. AGMB09787 TaxID=2922869 RepID=UPI001FAF285B|nr:aminoglycoside 6-adenylyltransferase [Anaerococcus sp. AGMB09787]